MCKEQIHIYLTISIVEVNNEMGGTLVHGRSQYLTLQIRQYKVI